MKARKLERIPERLDPDKVGDLSKVRYWHEAVPIFKYLLENGWGIKGWSRNDEKHTLRFISPGRKAMSPNTVLYYTITGKNPGDRNLYNLMENEDYDMRIFEKLQYLSSHPKHKSRFDFVQAVILPLTI